VTTAQVPTTGSAMKTVLIPSPLPMEAVAALTEAVYVYSKELPTTPIPPIRRAERGASQSAPTILRLTLVEQLSQRASGST